MRLHANLNMFWLLCLHRSGGLFLKRLVMLQPRLDSLLIRVVYLFQWSVHTLEISTSLVCSSIPQKTYFSVHSQGFVGSLREGGQSLEGVFEGVVINKICMAKGLDGACGF